MKIVTKLAIIPTLALLCCSIANAQVSYSNSLVGATLIYSNAFDGATVNISNTPPDYAVTAFGGSNNAVWLDAGGPGDTNAFYANGTVGTGQGDTILLPFVAQSNQVYTLTATVNMTGNPGSWVTCGYAQHYAMPGIANAAPNGSGVNSYAWTLRNFSGNTEYFAGAGGGHNIYNGTPAGQVNAGTYTYTQILNTTSNKWVTTAFFDGVQLGSPYTYTPAPSIGAIGLGQHALGAPGNYQWTSLALFASQLAILQEPESENVNQGASFTASVQMGGTPPFSYQWFDNGALVADATNADLSISSVSASDASTNYYCVITNVYGAVTSTPAILGIYSTPQFLSADPVTYTNLMTLFGGTNIDGTNYLGSSPSFSVFAGGLQPVTYFWQTNGVAVGGATNNSFTFINCQLDSPTNFSCIASNSLGTATNTWAAQYMLTPTAPYPQAILADGPVAYWRLDETNYDQTYNENDGEVCNDFMSGNNGIYTNVALAQTPGYYVTVDGNPLITDSNETAAYFGPPLPVPGAAFSVGTNVDFSAFSNAEFTVSVWANGGYLGDTYTEPANGGIVTKGGYGAEEFALDDGGSGGAVRFMVRNAADALSGAGSSLKLSGDDSWHFLVGVCDESNGVVNLYVDGLLAAQATISKDSGVLPSALAPITIGADGAGQFNGGLDDVAIFNSALSAGQVAQLYASAGGVNPLTITAPVPPTNFVWRQGTTLTIPAFAIGQPPLGYYWTNLTTASIVGGAGVKGGSGSSLVSTLTATLTITNASPSYSGDQLELVVTNATSSTNLFTTLFSYPPPITINYTNSILYSNVFNAGTWNLAGTAPTEVNSLAGGTNTTWTDALGTNDTGSLEGSGLDDTKLGDSWLLPFTPEPGYIYTITASAYMTGYPGSWIGAGFAATIPTNAVGSARFADPSILGYDFLIWVQNTGNVEFLGGPGGSDYITNVNNFISLTLPMTHTAQIVLDTTGAQWVNYAFMDGVPCGTNVYNPNPPISSAGITQSGLGAPNDVQWVSWSLTQVAPGGVPPYLLAPLPPTSGITLTNPTTTVTLNATAFGSAPMGYQWINNSSVLESGVTNTPNPSTPNNAAPEPANLSIPESSLSAGQLELVVTNAYGTNITVIPLVSPINPNPTNIVATLTNNNLYLTWPADHTGWQLQAQTNSLGVGLSTNWVDYNPSTGTNRVVVPVNPANGTVFYRLIYNP